MWSTIITHYSTFVLRNNMHLKDSSSTYVWNLTPLTCLTTATWLKYADCFITDHKVHKIRKHYNFILHFVSSASALVITISTFTTKNQHWINVIFQHWINISDSMLKQHQGITLLKCQQFYIGKTLNSSWSTSWPNFNLNQCWINVIMPAGLGFWLWMWILWSPKHLQMIQNGEWSCNVSLFCELYGL